MNFSEAYLTERFEKAYKAGVVAKERGDYHAASEYFTNAGALMRELAESGDPSKRAERLTTATRIENIALAMAKNAPARKRRSSDVPMSTVVASELQEEQIPDFVTFYPAEEIKCGFESVVGADEAKEQMQNAIAHLENELAKIRAGKANPKILNDVLVEYYGSPTPLSQIANITAPDPRTIAVQPWEKNMLAPIQKAIMNANLGFNPDNNGEIVRINVPPLTEERRKELVKQSKGVGETAKVSVRNARRDAIDAFKKMVKERLPEDAAKDAETEVQKITDIYNKKVDEILAQKEKDIMTI